MHVHDSGSNSSNEDSSTRRLATAIEASGDGVWEFEPISGRLWLSERFKHLLGYADDEMESARIEWESRIHPDDMERVLEVGRSHLSHRTAYDCEYRMRHQDGTWRWFRVRGAAQRDSDGHVTGVVGTLTDVDARRRVEESLRAECARAEARDAAKGAFLAEMSHEIRTPMNGVLGMTQLLAETPLDVEQSEYVRCILRSAENLLAVVNDILDLSKIEAGKLAVESIPFELDQVLHDTRLLFEHLTRQRGLAFAFEHEGPVVPCVVGDPTRIRQVLTNLVGNAVKFTTAGSVVVSTSSHRLDDERILLRFVVTDTGIGIPPERRSGIFEKFEQADASTTRRFGGTGLGLSICRELVQLMGGEIGVHSEVGRGSSFWFEIPMKVANANADGPSTESTRAADCAGMHVLVAEDDAVNRRLVEKLLEKLGCTSVCVSNGQDALDVLGTQTFHAILMDGQMPVLDGLATAAKIRAAEVDGERMPIIALTASAMRGDRERFLRAGLDDYLAKPLRVADLAAALARWRPRAPLPSGGEGVSRSSGVPFPSYEADSRRS